MIDRDWFQGLEARFDEPMSQHTTFEIGGPCDVMVFPTSIEDLVRIMGLAREKNLAHRIIGHGSNLLVKDRGLRELVIKLDKNFAGLGMQENYLWAQAGVFMEDLAEFALGQGLSGLEPLSGIPGNLGGMVAMNAGAYGTEMKDVIKEVRVLTADLKLRSLSVEDMHMAYRHSRVHEENLVVLEVLFDLDPDKKDKIQARLQDYRNRREEKQPLDFPSAGSTFKRPEGHYAAKLIDESGLRGAQIGGARVSDKHCGFVINYDQARAEDVLNLIEHIRKVVWDSHQVQLETEVKIIGD